MKSDNIRRFVFVLLTTSRPLCRLCQKVEFSRCTKTPDYFLRNHVLVYCKQEATVRIDFGETEGFRINKGRDEDGTHCLCFICAENIF